MSEQAVSSEPVSEVPPEIRAQALALGLDRLSDAHLLQFANAARIAAARRTVMQAGALVPADEPAHVYRLA